MVRASSFAVLVLVLITISACEPPQQVFQQRFLQFGTLIDITIYSGDEKKVIFVFNQIEELLKQRHTDWHGWEAGTLSQFNKDLALHPEKGIEIPPSLQVLINTSRLYYEISNGLFNPAMGKLIAAWGFHNKSTPDYSVINNIQSDIPGMHDLVIKNNLAYSLNSQLKLDFGAIAKGLAVEQIANLVKAQNFKHFIINAGGDIFAQGKKNQHNWKIAIESPFSDDIIGKLEITSPSGIFTSGNYRRFYLDQNNIRRHHIINPITGEPSENISAVTILHRDPMLADIAATTLMLTPTDSIKKMAQQLKIQDFMVITEQQTVLISKSLNKKIIWKPDLDLNIQII